MELEDIIIFYTTPEHLNPTISLTKFITKHHPSISITIISTAPESSVTKTPSSITYRRLNAVNLPDNFTTDPVERFFEIPRLQNPNLLEALQQISEKSKIKALVIDFFCNSAFEVSTSLKIPLYYDVSVSASDLCAFLYHPTIHDTIPQNFADLNDFVEIPGCPLVQSSDLPMGMFYRKSNIYKHLMDTSINMRKSSGILVNAFDALEYRAKTALTNGLCNPDGPSPPVYLVSPAIAETETHAPNGDVSMQKHECLRWLDLQPSKSVVFLCFGRRGSFKSQQLREIAIGLEQSGCRFLWAVRNLAESDDLDLNELLPEGFLARTKEVGLVISTWAPQKEVLSHDAVGGFVTHCGWNSVLEAVSFGVPMIGWPLYAEQRMNRVFMVEEMKVALPLDEEENGLVNAVEIEKRVRELMETVKGRGVRRRVEELRIAAKAAVREGGSSLVALEKFVEAVSG